VKETAFEGGFKINTTEPPDFLCNKSDAFFGGTSTYDFCIYAMSLSYLDMCIVQYTITDIQAFLTDFMIMKSSGMFLIIQQGLQGGQKIWKPIMVSIDVIFPSPESPGFSCLCLSF